MYRTGDIAWYGTDGRLYFHGRRDHQIKIRGFRIELGEIQSKLSEHPAVQESIVLAWKHQNGEMKIVAYVVPALDLRPEVHELRNFLKATLPQYMVPADWVILEALPLTPNGKVDRKALPLPEYNHTKPEEDSLPTKTAMEQLISEVWQEVLGLDQVGVYDNFFDLGGHSLSSVQVVSKLEGKLGFRLDLRDLLFQTLGQSAAQCEERLNQGGTP
jgi:acyl carrier protein